MHTNMNLLVIFISIFALVSISMAFPGMPTINPRQTLPNPLPLSANEGNSGPILNLGFNAADQYVDVTPGSANEYIPPSATDIRGPCPGLNAAANHGFLPRNGIANIAQTITGLGEAYSLGPVASSILGVFAVAITGDPIAGTWSIGGPYKSGGLGGGLLGSLLGGLFGGLQSNPEGISFSHNQYEGDASVARNDAYLNHGDAHSLNVSRFDDLYFRAESYTPDVLRDHNEYVHEFSVNNNPYYFALGLSNIVPTGAHQLIVNCMSNHSLDNIQGYLDRDTLKSFFSVTGPDNAHVWNPGQEQIPQNWYKRPSSNPYEVPAILVSGPSIIIGILLTLLYADLAITAVTYPSIIQVGGNTGTVNSFTGVDIGDLTGGVYNAETLLQGNNLGCFAFQAAQLGLPSILKGLLSELAPALSLVNQYLSPVLDELNCPALTSLNENAFNQFPGYNYHPAPS